MILDSNFLSLNNAEFFQQQLLQTVIFLNLSFQAIENLAFWILLCMLDSFIHISQWIKLQTAMNTLFNEIKERFLESLNSIIKISIVLNKWKSMNNFLFQDVIRSYITRDWMQKKVLLDFESLMSTHDDAYLADVMHKILIDFEIEQ